MRAALSTTIDAFGRLDVAFDDAAVLWLCSGDTAFTVGHAMVVDGGRTA
ncbi:hypothetical protein [Saccharothrix yanglingensis]|nr:hypothetical protein [Saccharothrix yanglingensis]